MGDRLPNIVLINCDDLGYGDLGCYGSKVNHTPRIDRMAAEGLRFTDFYMASPVCSPSRAAMLTGCYPSRIGFGGPDAGGIAGVLFPGWPIGLNPDEITIAKLLQRAGYATALIGKWHCGDQPEFLPTNHGFDRYFGIPYSNDMGRQAEPESGVTTAQLKDLLDEIGHTMPFHRPPLPLLDGEDVAEQQPDQSTLTQRYVAESVDFMRSHRNQPFFLYFSHMYVHLPIYVTDEFRRSSSNGDYGAAIACIDWAAGAIMDELTALGLDDDTLVVFTSDNGALDHALGGSGSNEPLRAWKGSTFEGGQRVSCIMRWPTVIEPGGVSSEVTTALDFYRTFAALAGLDVPDDRVVDGRDLSSLLGRPGQALAFDDPFFYINDGAIEAVRRGRWKLHVRKVGAEVRLLFDLQEDPAESDNVADDYPTVVDQLTACIDEARQDFGDSSVPVVGANSRPIGRVDSPVPLTEFDPDHPYFMAEYDLADRG